MSERNIAWKEWRASARSKFREAIEWLSPLLEWLLFTGILSLIPLAFTFLTILNSDENTSSPLTETLRHGELLIISTVLCADALGKLLFRKGVHNLVRGLVGFAVFVLGMVGAIYFGSIKHREITEAARFEHVYKIVQKSDARSADFSDIISYARSNPIQFESGHAQEIQSNSLIFYFGAILVGCFCSMIAAESKKGSTS